MFERIILTQINPHVYLMDDNHEATGYIVICRNVFLTFPILQAFQSIH